MMLTLDGAEARAAMNTVCPECMADPGDPCGYLGDPKPFEEDCFHLSRLANARGLYRPGRVPHEC